MLTNLLNPRTRADWPTAVHRRTPNTLARRRGLSLDVYGMEEVSASNSLGSAHYCVIVLAQAGHDSRVKAVVRLCGRS